MTSRPAFVLAGGLSSRMGRDKAQLPWQGKTFLVHALDTLNRAGFSPAVAGLREPVDCGYPIVADRFQDAGPLGGIEAALCSVHSHTPGPVLFLPIDLPLIHPDFLALLWERAALTGAWATVATFGGRLQPLCAVYHSTLASGVAQSLAEGDRKVVRVMQRLVPAPRFDRFRIEAVAAVRGWSHTHTWFTNFNNPIDLAHLRASFTGNSKVVEAPASI